MKSLCLPSYAKINFGLFISGKRADGFHEIETILYQISLKDTIEIALSDQPDISLTCDNPDIPTDSTNLCVRAANLLRSYSGITTGAQIHLKKQIPVGAGLGGGSSNAAVTLLGLNKFLELGLSSKILQELSAEIGSDVPFFIEGGTALATGKGDKLSEFSIDLQEKPILVVFPKVSIATAWAYDKINLDLTKSKKNLTFASFKDNNFNNVDFFKVIRNDFEDVLFQDYPILKEIKIQLYQGGANYAALSGSGSAMFGIFGKETDAKVMEEEFSGKYQTFITRHLVWGYRQIN